MSPISLQDQAEKTGFLPNALDIAPSNESERTPEDLNRMIARAKEIIAGRVVPPPMVVPPEVQDFIKREYSGLEPPPTDEAIRFITEDLCLQSHFRDSLLACYKTADGSSAVLAVGRQEVFALLDSLSWEERPKVLITDTF